jgi:hypothetical protein
MDELERIESQRWSLFVVEAIAAFVLFYWLTGAVLGSIVVAVGVGWSMSGYKLAQKMTQPHAWAHIEAEARISGYSPSRLGIWLGNVLPGMAVAALGAWLMLSA